MSDKNQQEREELEQKILAKRQEIEFEKTSISLESEFSAENNINPDVSEEFKNYDDPASNVIEKGELKELSDSEKELIDLIDKLNKLKRED